MNKTRSVFVLSCVPRVVYVLRSAVSLDSYHNHSLNGLTHFKGYQFTLKTHELNKRLLHVCDCFCLFTLLWLYLLLLDLSIVKVDFFAELLSI